MHFGTFLFVLNDHDLIGSKLHPIGANQNTIFRKIRAKNQFLHVPTDMHDNVISNDPESLAEANGRAPQVTWHWTSTLSGLHGSKVEPLTILMDVPTYKGSYEYYTLRLLGKKGPGTPK